MCIIMQWGIRQRGGGEERKGWREGVKGGREGRGKRCRVGCRREGNRERKREECRENANSMFSTLSSNVHFLITLQHRVVSLSRLLLPVRRDWGLTADSIIMPTSRRALDL
jgi:hypothetical protein